jgi:prepilin-type N-terminal cleavage/methylation domain-containing protein
MIVRLRAFKTKRMQDLRAGFTLIEVLAAFAVTAVILTGMGALIRHVGFAFDKGVYGVNEAERFALAMDRLAHDFAAARFILRRPGPPQTALQSDAQGGEAAQDKQWSAEGQANKESVLFLGEATKIIFVSNAAQDASGAGFDEVVTLTVEPMQDGASQLVRRRAPWLGPRDGSLFSEALNPVILIKGNFDISFSFGRLTQEGALVWAESWDGERFLPSVVRVNLRDRMTGANLSGSTEFFVRADVPVTCLSDRSNCLSDGRRKKEQSPGNGRQAT